MIERPRDADAPRVTVLLSARLAGVGAGLDLGSLREWLEVRLALRSRILADVEGSPAEIAAALGETGAERLVLGLTHGEHHPGSLQAVMRRAGLDPLGVEVLNLGAHAALLSPRPEAMDRAKLLLAGAVAKARSFRGSGPEHLRPSVSVTMGRRSLITLTAKEYHVVPSVLRERCAVEQGCRRCVEACPRRALRHGSGRIEIDRLRCESCGLCLGACPSEAVALPGHSYPEVDAQVVALADPTLVAPVRRGLVFLCARNAGLLETSIKHGWRYPSDWLPVVVPCVGMLSATSFLRPLALGLEAVGVVPCGGVCPFGQDAAVAERVDFAQRLLASLGAERERVRLLPQPGAEPVAWQPAVPDGPVRPQASPIARRWPGRGVHAETVLALARAQAAPADLRLPHPRSPLAVIEIDAARCTACGSCAEACPTGALSLHHDHDAIAIRFDAALCGGCALCGPCCPERDVLRLEPAVDRRRLEAGAMTLARAVMRRCVRCGTAIASSAMLTRLAILLGHDYATLAPTIARYCSNCRAASAPDGEESGAVGSLQAP